MADVEKKPYGMERLHPSVRKVAEFVEREIQQEERIAVAGFLHAAAPLLWPKGLNGAGDSAPEHAVI